MRLDDQLLDYWTDLLSRDSYQKSFTCVYHPEDMAWAFDLHKMDLQMEHAQFKAQKLTYLKKKYPLDNLGPEGCIAAVDGNTFHYRKVDPFRGLIADLVYFKHLGYKRIKITGEPYCCKIHVLRAGCVYPQIWKYGDIPDFKDNSLAVGIWRGIKYRMDRMSHDTHGMSRIMNFWFEELNTRSAAEKAHAQLGKLCGKM